MLRKGSCASSPPRSISAMYNEEIDGITQQAIAVLDDFDTLVFVENTTPSRGLWKKR